MPLIFIVIIPAIAAMLPGVELTPKLALVPILNVSLLCKELVIGTYHWNYIAIIFASTSVYASAALFLAIKMFQRESVLFRSYLVDTPFYCPSPQTLKSRTLAPRSYPWL